MNGRGSRAFGFLANRMATAVAQSAETTLADSSAVDNTAALMELDDVRLSLLDIVRQRAEAMGLVEKIQRVMIALKYAKPSDTGNAVKSLVDSIVQKIEDEDEQGGKLTGLLLLLPGCGLMILEGPQRLVIGSLKMLHESKSQDSIESIHVFSSIQDAPGRSFHLWASRTLQLPKVDGQVPDKEHVATMIPDMSINLQKFGRKLRHMPQSDCIQALDNIQRLHGEVLPKVEDVLGLCGCQHVMTLKEFFDLYYTPTMCLGGPLDSEVCWPLPASLSY